MAHAQKPDFVFRRNGRVHLNWQRRQFSRLLAAEVCASEVVMLDTSSSEVVKGTGYPLHSPVSPSLPLPCVTVCHHVSTGLYNPGRKSRSIFLAKVSHFRVGILRFLFGIQTLHCRRTRTYKHTHTQRRYAQRFFLRYSCLYYNGRTPLIRNIKTHRQM